MISEGRFMEMADTLRVGVGDYVFVEPGTLHAITAGSLVYEIEEGSDFTYRFFDYDRVDASGNRRELHVAKATDALDIHLKSVVRTYGDGEIREKTYATRLVADMHSYTNDSRMVECFTLVKGALSCDGQVVACGSTVMLWPGETLDVSGVELGFVARLLEDCL